MIFLHVINKINGNGLISIPGAIDTHVHYGVYSPINEAAKTESHAAAIGGVTTMMRMLRLEKPFFKFFTTSTPNFIRISLCGLCNTCFYFYSTTN